MVPVACPSHRQQLKFFDTLSDTLSTLALPVDTCNAVYATTGHSASVTNLARISFAQDNVFSDGTTLQLASVTGSVEAGYVATLTVGIAA